jgi:hypothetical protein
MLVFRYYRLVFEYHNYHMLVMLVVHRFDHYKHSTDKWHYMFVFH